MTNIVGTIHTLPAIFIKFSAIFWPPLICI